MSLSAFSFRILTVTRHSVGRGGLANLTSEHEPPIEHYKQHAQEYESTGRGGAGNIVHEIHKS
jgi:hypothetical protein